MEDFRFTKTQMGEITIYSVPVPRFSEEESKQCAAIEPNETDDVRKARIGHVITANGIRMRELAKLLSMQASPPILIFISSADNISSIEAAIAKLQDLHPGHQISMIDTSLNGGAEDILQKLKEGKQLLASGITGVPSVRQNIEEPKFNEIILKDLNQLANDLEVLKVEKPTWYNEKQQNKYRARNFKK